MTERSGQFDENDTPEDVASLYSWANLHGAKYRDFSESRAQTREKARQRVEQAMEEERLRAMQGAEPKRGNGDTRHDEPATPSTQRPPAPAYPAQSGPPSTGREDLASALRGLSMPSTYRPTNPPPHTPMREDSYPRPQNPRGDSDRQENQVRPAWLTPERQEPASAPSLPQAPEDTLQGSRDRLATRWYALRGVF
jgi:hypothetical protein